MGLRIKGVVKYRMEDGADPTTIPAPTTITGATITAGANNPNLAVTGLTTNQGISPGDYVWHSNTLKRIKSVSLDLKKIVLKDAFTGAITAQNLVIVRAFKVKGYEVIGLNIASTFNGYGDSPVEINPNVPIVAEAEYGLDVVVIDPNSEKVYIVEIH
jgi:hypothetical protein